mgnify:CR=1 FL=1
MFDSKQISVTLMHDAECADLLLRKKHNISVIGRVMYEALAKAVQNGAGVDNILTGPSVEISIGPREFAKVICQDAAYRIETANLNAEMPGKLQNKSGETQPNGYAKTAGKPQNKLDKSLKPDNTNSTRRRSSHVPIAGSAEKETQPAGETTNAYCNGPAFAVIRDIHQKDGLRLCYDKTIVAALHTPHGVFLGTNGIKKLPSQHICPRKGQNINQGYDKCVEKCRQPSHAELAALLKYKARVPEPDFENSRMTVYGAKEVCYHCKTTLELVGIRRIILKPLKQLGEIHGYQ